MKNKIIRVLKELEEENDIEILYACESGSRIWGFENDESDWDIRFIYRKTNLKDYLSLKNTSEVIECYIGDLDIVGWDIKKALILHYKDNPNLREWILSNQVYVNKGINSVFSNLGGFNIDVLKNHYASIALKNWKKYSNLKFDRTKTKQYLYILRSILCWNLLNRDIYPPINIYELLNHDFINLSDEIRLSIEILLKYHKNECEINETTVIKLNNFILSSLNRMKTVKVNSLKDIDDYDEKFRELVFDEVI